MSVKETVIDLVTRIIYLGLPIHQIILFGSYARGEQRCSSDIDIAIVGDDSLDSKQRGAIRDIACDLERDRSIDLFFTTKNKLEKIEEFRFNTNRDIKNEGVILWDKIEGIKIMH